MEQQRNTQMMHHYLSNLTNAVSFPPLPPSTPSTPFFSDHTFLPPYTPHNISFNNLYPPFDPHDPIDTDPTFSNLFSSLHISPATYPHSPTFPPQKFSASFEGLGRRSNGQRWDDDSGSGSGFGVDHKSNLDVCNKNGSERYDNNNNINNNINNNNKFVNLWSVKKLRGRIYTMAKDQNGCKILQELFERPTVEEIEIVLSEVVEYVPDLMNDQFGNYLVQKLVVVCNEEQKMQILLSLVDDIVLVCMSPHGTRAVQKLLENLQDPNQVMFVMKALQHGASTLATDPNGHHVVQYCLVNFHTDINMPILTEIANKCYKIATDKSGCCVLQACVEHARGEVRTRIIAEIMVNSVQLAEDPFGNYVLQHMVGLNIPELTALLVRQLKGNFAYLSCNKYGSNVVEKCLNESGEGISTLIVLELIRSPNSSLLLVDPYANFVIQSALKVSKGFVHDCLRDLISKNILSMQTNIYGKRILGRFNKKKANFA